MIIDICTNTDPTKRFKSISGFRAAVFGVLSAPPSSNVDPEATEIAERLAKADSLTPEHMNKIRQFLRGEREAAELWVVFTALDEDALSALHEKKVTARKAGQQVPNLETVICGRNRLRSGSGWA